MAIRITRKKILIAVVALLLIMGGAVGYFFMTGQLFQRNDTTGTPDDIGSTGNAYRQRLTKVQTEVTDLVTAGDEKSIEEAEQLLNTEVEAAKKSGNPGYVVEASSAKASLLVETGRAQEGLDALLALEQQYGSDDEYKYELYALISWAYREIDDQVKAEEYFNKIPSQGWDE